MGSLFVYFVLLLSVFNTESRTLTSRVESTPAGCEWQRVLTLEETSEETVTTILNCQLRTIGGTESLLGNLTGHQIERLTSLKLSCSDVLFFESSLETNKHQGSFLGQLRRLKDLEIEFCKIRYVPAMVLSSLRDLRSLSLRTHNTDWSAMTMEFHPESFRGLTELRVLDLADNNIWSLPTEVFCPLFSLQVLNLTRNRLQDVSQLGFSDYGNGPTSPGKSCNTGLETLDMSFNEITSLPDNGLSSLRSLQTLLLQENVLSSLADRPFVGLTSLKILNMSSNALVALPPELFQSSRDLSQLYLQNNSLSVLAPGILEGLDQLQVLDLSRNELTSRWVNRDTFSGLVRLVVLNLAHNSITRIDGQVFQDLYSLQILSLDNNGIEVIAEGAFAELKNLHALTLSQNKLTEIESYHFTGLYVLNQLFLDSNHIKNIHERAFENMTNLHDLGLNENLLSEIPNGIGKLHYLKSLDLGKNLIKTVHNSSFEGLDQLFGLRLVDNLIVNISRDAFMTLPSLQVLNLASNQIKHVDQSAFGSNPTLRAIRLDGNRLEDISGVFTNLPGLVWLNVSDNQLRWFDYSHLPASLEWLDMHQNNIAELGNYFGVRTNLHIKMLDASFNKLTSIVESSIPDSVETLFLNNNNITSVEAGTFLNKTNLEKVVLYANELRKIELASFGLTPVPEHKTMPQFYISGNPFHCDCTMEWMQRINQLSHHRQYPRIMDLDTVTCSLPHSRGSPVRPLMDLKPSQFLCPYESHCFALCHCCDFDACDCEMTCPDRCSCYHDHTWSSNVVDCSNAGYTNVPEKIPMDATEIYLDGNDLGQLGSHVFIGKKKLQVLFLNNSNIDALHNRTFNGATALRVLHIENNQLEELRGFEFKELSNLNELYLDHNVIAHVGNNTFASMHNLEILRLDENKIVDFSPWQQLQAATQSGSLSKVSLEGNKWSCDCDSVSKLESWLLNNNGDPDKMLCNSTNGKTSTETIGAVIRKCKSERDENMSPPSVHRTVLQASGLLGNGYIPLLAAALVAVIGASLLVALAFVFRQDVRLWAHAKYGVRLFKDSASTTESQDDRDRLYDGYVVYSSRDEDFVSRVIASELEQGGHTLCLHHRDIHGTSYLADSLLSACDASRRILLVLSLNFLQNEWSRPEFRAALQATLESIRPCSRRHKIILLITTTFETIAMDPTLQILLRTCTVISWGEKRFWDKLRFSMPDVPGFKTVKRNPGTNQSSKKVPDVKKSPNLRYTAAPTSLDTWYKNAVPMTTPIHGMTSHTPTPTQSTYASESHRSTEDEVSSVSTSSNSQHYDVTSQHGYMTIDSRGGRRSLRDSTASIGHVYSTIPEAPVMPPQPVGRGRTYFV